MRRWDLRRQPPRRPLHRQLGADPGANQALLRARLGRRPSAGRDRALRHRRSWRGAPGRCARWSATSASTSRSRRRAGPGVPIQVVGVGPDQAALSAGLSGGGVPRPGLRCGAGRALPAGARGGCSQQGGVRDHRGGGAGGRPAGDRRGRGWRAGDRGGGEDGLPGAGSTTPTRLPRRCAGSTRLDFDPGGATPTPSASRWMNFGDDCHAQVLKFSAVLTILPPLSARRMHAEVAVFGADDARLRSRWRSRARRPRSSRSKESGPSAAAPSRSSRAMTASCRARSSSRRRSPVCPHPVGQVMWTGDERTAQRLLLGQAPVVSRRRLRRSTSPRSRRLASDADREAAQRR